jgi:phosphatidylglycerol---prolipoprotein diacylglyceryl transferase
MIQPIKFPGLGLKFTIDPTPINVFGIVIHWYCIIIATGFISALLLALKDSKKFNIIQDDIINLIIIATPLAILGARLYYVIFKWYFYSISNNW